MYLQGAPKGPGPRPGPGPGLRHRIVSAVQANVIASAAPDQVYVALIAPIAPTWSPVTPHRSLFLFLLSTYLPTRRGTLAASTQQRGLPKVPLPLQQVSHISGSWSSETGSGLAGGRAQANQQPAGLAPRALLVPIVQLHKYLCYPHCPPHFQLPRGPVQLDPPAPCFCELRLHTKIEGWTAVHCTQTWPRLRALPNLNSRVHWRQHATQIQASPPTRPRTRSSTRHATPGVPLTSSTQMPLPNKRPHRQTPYVVSLPSWSSSALLMCGRTANSLKLSPRAETQRRCPSFGYSESPASPTPSGARPKKLIKDAEHDRSQVRSPSAVEIGRLASPALSSLTNGKRPSAYA